ncbi:MAG: SBBP repeat-containing protein, partial [Actinomycetota bacterium]|nr:SBBP repeat-containing protein [Actinomycetota bacterium]
MPARPLVARVLAVVAVIAAVGGVTTLAVSDPPHSGDARATPNLSRPLEQLPLAFEPLAVAGDGPPAFGTSGPGYRATLGVGGEALVTTANGQLRMALGGTQARPPGQGRQPLAGRSHFLVGRDPARWRTDVPRFGAVAYESVYPGIDLVYHGQRRNLEYDFVLAPGVSPAAIDLILEGDGEATLDAEGNLVLSSSAVRMEKPVVYQEVSGRRHPVEGRFVIRAPGHVGFEIGEHDSALPVVIDPVLVSSTYLGGTGIDSSYGVAVDRRGNVYVTGYTESGDFQTANAVQPSLNEGSGVRTDAFVAKLNPAGTELLYATYFGGGDRDTGRAVAVGTDGAAYVAGTTESPDFPTTRPAQDAYGGGTSDAFLVKLNPEGSAVDYATTIGGSSLDEGNGVAVDAGGNVSVTGSTTSTNFPTVAPMQAVLGGEVDAFVTRVSGDGAGFTYSTYLGGASDDHGLAVALGRSGDAYITGDTASVNFPTVRPFQPRFGGVGDQTGRGPDVAGDAFVTHLDGTGSSLVFSTYLGGNDSDSAAGIAVDSEGTVHVTGTTGSPNFPTAKAQQSRKSGDFDAFVTAMDADGAELVYSTYLGGSSSDGATAVAVDSDRRAAVVGATSSSDFPVVDAFQRAKVGGFVDGFVASYGSGGQAELASYVGGGDEDQATGVAVDADGTLHIAGYTNSGNFPTARPFRATKTGTVGDAFLSAVSQDAAAGASSTARAGRLRLLLITTIALLLAAVGLTFWLRRHPE